MGWESRYPTRHEGDLPLENYSIQVLVFDRLKPLGSIPESVWNEQIKQLQFALTQPGINGMQKAVKCVALIWGVILQMKRPRQSVVEVVKAVTSFVPTGGPADSIGDLISMGAEIVGDYVGNYRNAINSRNLGDTISKEQVSILTFMDPASWGANETLGQWAEKLLYIGEVGISGSESGTDKAIRDIRPDNVDALDEYMRVVRPLLYHYRKSSVLLTKIT